MDKYNEIIGVKEYVESVVIEEWEFDWLFDW